MAAKNNINWSTTILDQLDVYAKEYNFPMLDNAYLNHADVRLTAFRSSSEWAILFEEIAFSEWHGFINDVSAYGNKIKKPGTQGPTIIISELPGNPIWDDDGNFLLNRYSFEVMIQGKARSFRVSPEDYQRAGIDVNSKMSAPAQLLRLLAFSIPNDFFMTDRMLLSKCGRTNSSLKKFIQLEDWYHPDIANDELPSENVCFQNLAHSIAKNNKDIYVCPHELLNTHWSNWEYEE
jgi:hypothetical protein